MFYENTAVQDRVKYLFYRVYGWMTLGLGLTAVSAFLLAAQPRWVAFVMAHPYAYFIALLVQFGVVIAFTALLPRLSFSSALALFLFYALLSGITLSLLFRAYSTASIVQAFVITAGMFGSASLYGYMTGSDLSKVGSFLYMALWGLILSLLVNLFVRSSLFTTLLSCAGVLIFTVLTAYDVQMIRRYALTMQLNNASDYGKVGLLGALNLYLDFINLFLNLLTLMGGRRRE